ncbi:hypothetical protein I6E26_10145 [Anaerovibrio lipolyticus]|uniref:flagellin N-terminal helical domain-containing protein n=1 Tax=Anaerovibrio lipolyticus TaxID=82374 RepID=UPI001F3C212F|nr:flagellin [Anaerovibrio lipolyticus]MCF2601892.1 hypothetical protein [Anaerovibrio lipolyticus]
MGMSIYNNLTAMSALHENNRNEKSLAKMLKRAASGMKINSAGDDASGYAISEKMRVKLRALEQNDRNVKNGASMLRTASGAVQEQTNLLKTIKQKVIDASNDTNTDQDREVIQKEIDHCYSQMADIVYDTEFNGKKILLGNSVAEVVSSWEVLNNAMLADDSDIPGLLADANESSLDGEQGPFATFGKASDKPPYDGYNKKAESPATWKESSAKNNGDRMVGGTKGVSNTIDLDLSQYANFSATNRDPLDNTTFCVNSPYYPQQHYFTLTTNMSNNYEKGSKIDISGCGSTDDVANAIQNAIASSLGNVYSVSVSGSKVTLTTKQDGVVTNGNDYNTEGATLTGGTPPNGHDGATGTGLNIGAFTGGKDAITHTETRTDPADPDLKHTVTVEDVPAVKAKLEIPNISSVAPGSGMTINDAYYGTSYLSFRYDDGGLNYDSASGHYTVGRNYQGNFNISGMHCSMSNGSLIAEVSTGGVYAGRYSSITDGIKPYRPTYTATTALTGINNKHSGADGNTAHWDLDLSAYNASDETMAEELINRYKGKTFGTNTTTEYEFIDTGSSSGMDGLYKVTTNTIDLNEVRNQVKAGKTVAEAFANVLNGLNGHIGNTEILKAADNTTNGIRIKATSPGEAGNNQKVFSQTGELRHYTIDWKNWVKTQGITDIPAALHEKGIRFYCPTDASQWVNVRFVNGFSDLDAERPASGNANMDIKTLTIDLSAVDSVETLVETIDTKLGDYLKNKYKHNLLVTSDPKAGTTTIYDQRRKTVRNNPGYDNQEKGAKIGTGIMDNIIKTNRNIYVNDLVVQHTDKASMNIHVKIPQTSIDQIFGYKEGTRHISEYNVMTKDMRDKLLGIPPDKGILDRGIDYLLDAQTTIGAQMNHMDYADNNIITSHENITSAESVVRDADMAKTMMEYAKSNLLAQGSQSMLAQANQTPQAVISLLQ